MKRVVIVQRRLTNYRVKLFDLMRESLDRLDVRLQLLVGQGTPEEYLRRNDGELGWEIRLPTRYWLDGRLCWQPFGKYICDADLVIVTQENKLIYNLWLLLKSRKFKLAFWGHGGNLQTANPNSLKEKYKCWTTTRVDWWFAYTVRSADRVKAAGFPMDRITVLNNAIDTASLRRDAASVTPEEHESLRRTLGLQGKPVAAYIGSLYANKRLDFLFAAAQRIREQIPNFELLVIGDGSEAGKMKCWATDNDWLHWVGAKMGRDKVLYLSLAQLILIPGSIGLSILDSFALGIPLITTDCGQHGPEIVYLSESNNGVMTKEDVAVYAAKAVAIMNDERELTRLRSGCKASASEYTLENMVSSFVDGIMRALALKIEDVV
jgi:L-malate glycosyltransferase